MKYRIQQKSNVESNVNIITSCNISFTSSKANGWEAGKFAYGNYFHIMTNLPASTSYNTNYIFTVSSERINSDNNAATKVFGVVGVCGNQYNTISYSEDYGTLYFFGKRYNAIISNLDLIYNHKAKTLTSLINPSDYPTS